ncbi:MAG: hypothetical protein MH204_03415 [Fimbriimonadaceae bacterium]|nr:hypothetical protein [Fimbriimonadaceae bacterium]
MIEWAALIVAVASLVVSALILLQLRKGEEPIPGPSRSPAEAWEAAVLSHRPGPIRSWTSCQVRLWHPDQKAMLIGRGGANHRAFEHATGVDLVIDESPQSVTLSSFEPRRREAARLALLNLLAEGRIHPESIENAWREAEEALARHLVEATRADLAQLRAPTLPDAVIAALADSRVTLTEGGLLWDRLRECFLLARSMAAELGVEDLSPAALISGLGPLLPGSGPSHLRLLEAGLPPNISEAAVRLALNSGPTQPADQPLFWARDAVQDRPGADRTAGHRRRRELERLERSLREIPGVGQALVSEGGRRIWLWCPLGEADRVLGQAREAIRSVLEPETGARIHLIEEARRIEDA